MTSRIGELELNCILKVQVSRSLWSGYVISKSCDVNLTVSRAIFMDGTKMDADSESGFFLSYRLLYQCCVFQAELFSIWMSSKVVWKLIIPGEYDGYLSWYPSWIEITARTVFFSFMKTIDTDNYVLTAENSKLCWDFFLSNIL